MTVDVEGLSRVAVGVIVTLVGVTLSRLGEEVSTVVVKGGDDDINESATEKVGDGDMFVVVVILEVSGVTGLVLIPATIVDSLLAKKILLLIITEVGVGVEGAVSVIKVVAIMIGGGSKRISSISEFICPAIE